MERKEKEVRWKKGLNRRMGPQIKMPAMTSFNHQVEVQGNVRPLALGDSPTPPLPFPSEKPHLRLGLSSQFWKFLNQAHTSRVPKKKKIKTRKKDKLNTTRKCSPWVFIKLESWRSLKPSAPRPCSSS